MVQYSFSIKSFYFLIYFLIFFQDFHCFAADEENQITVIKNLQNDLLIYDKDLQNYLPYTPNAALVFPTLSYYINLNLYSGYKIQHCLPSGSSLFIDQKIVDFTKIKSCTSYNIDSLKKIYQKDTLFVTIFNESLNAKDVKVSVILEQVKKDDDELNAESMFSIIPRSFTGFNDFFVIGLIIVMILIAVLYNGNIKYFQEFYNLPKALSFKIREESYIAVKNFSSTYLLFLVVHSFLVGLIVITILHYYEGFQDLLGFVNTGEFWFAFLSWLQVSAILLCLFIGKYVLVKAISQLFNIGGFSSVHFFDFIRMSIGFFLLVLITLCILLYAFNFEDQIWFQPLIHSIVVFFIIRTVVLFFKLYKYAPFRNLHLFLYICSTELLPLMIGFKIFIN